MRALNHFYLENGSDVFDVLFIQKMSLRVFNDGSLICLFNLNVSKFCYSLFLFSKSYPVIMYLRKTFIYSNLISVLLNWH